jgi:hypothetical protein
METSGLQDASLGPGDVHATGARYDKPAVASSLAPMVSWSAERDQVSGCGMLSSRAAGDEIAVAIHASVYDPKQQDSASKLHCTLAKSE